MAQKEVKQRIGSVKNVQKITRAMEMVAAARLRKAEQRIAALRPYADAIRRMTRQAAEAAQNVPNLPILQDRPDAKVVYMAYGSALTRHVTREVLLPTQQATIAEAEHVHEDTGGEHGEETGHTALTEYEPEPGEILERLIPDYVEISIYRALLESTA